MDYINKAEDYINNKDYDNYYKILLEGADNDDYECIKLIEQDQFNYRQEISNEEDFIEFLKEKSKNGGLYSKYYLAWEYFIGSSLPKDRKMGFKLMEELYNDSHSGGYYFKGYCLKEDQKIEESLVFFEKGALLSSYLCKLEIYDIFMSKYYREKLNDKTVNVVEILYNNRQDNPSFINLIGFLLTENLDSILKTSSDNYEFLYKYFTQEVLDEIYNDNTTISKIPNNVKTLCHLINKINELEEDKKNFWNLHEMFKPGGEGYLEAKEEFYNSA